MTDFEDATAYRTELRRGINMHKGVGRQCRPVTLRERFLRASWIALRECPRLVEDPTWTIEEYIEQMVEYRYPGAGRFSRSAAPEGGRP
jgi:hypothetical protein